MKAHYVFVVNLVISIVSHRGEVKLGFCPVSMSCPVISCFIFKSNSPLVSGHLPFLVCLGLSVSTCSLLPCVFESASPFVLCQCVRLCSYLRTFTSGGFHDSFPRISLRRSVHQKESFVCSFVRSFSRVSGSGESFSESFVCSFSRVSGSGESFSESFRLTSSLRPSFSFANRECQPSRSDSLPPSVPRSRSRIANASRVVQTHFRPPSLVLVRECQPSRSDSLPPSFTTFKRITKSRFTIVQWCKCLSINTTLTKLI